MIIFYKKRVTIPNEDGTPATYKIFSSNPQGVEIITPDLVVGPGEKGKIGLLFKKHNVQEEKMFNIYIFKNKEPLEKIMLTTKYVTGG